MAPEIMWDEIQRRIWECEACRGQPRVAIKIRQQTAAPAIHVAVLFVGVAPPHEGGVCVRTRAKSATNDPSDNLRTFIEEAAASRWDDLIAKGAFRIHAVKCAIIADDDGFQNPPNPVVDCCSPVGFVDEFQILRPARTVTLGSAARRAVLNHPAVTVPRGVGVSKPLEDLLNSWPDGIPCSLGTDAFILDPAPFPRSAATKRRAATIIRKAVRLAGLVNGAG
ncbi:MAG: hypothetical protein HYY19_00140 [Candidatus Rokubacteria bacterium]|nr:hypothetical protein [Candidatus Rokubacteria bacterium]